jgi:hypothetical protein
MFHTYPPDRVYHQSMPRVAPRVPELSEVLCSSCGYVLDGLPETGACPECGQPIAASVGADRVAPAWESADLGSRGAGFVQTTTEIILRPAKFYRTFTARGPLDLAGKFARLHWWIAGGLFGLTGATHAVWFSYRISPHAPDFPGGAWSLFAVLAIGLTLLTYFTLDLTTRVAARLTNWEATYRGIRLPYEIVLRGLYYHAAHYLPVAAAAVIIVEGYQLLLLTAGNWLPFNSAMIYLYILCGLVVLSAFYLFQTYWVGMRNMMYANR